METVADRINRILDAEKIKKRDLAKRLKISDSSVSTMCSGKSNPSGQTITMICKEFGIREEWLKYGKGEMFVPVAKDQSVLNFVEQTLQRPNDDFKRRFVSALPELTESDWETLEKLSLLFTKSS